MRGSKKSFLILIAIFAIVLSGLAIVANAASVVGEFELDGNTVDSAPGTPYDWDTLPGAVLFTDPGAPAVSGCPAGEDDNFSGGGSTELTPGTWQFTCGNVPSKDDFTEARIGTREIGASHWLYLSFVRLSDSGSSHLNFEFNRSAATFDNDNNPATPQIPVRTNGDLLVALEVSNGGAVNTPLIFKWSGTQTSGNWIPTGGSPTQGTDWDVATNGTPKFTFAEMAVRLEAFGVSPSCPGFGKAWIKSSTTTDFNNGVLKDRTDRKDVPLNSCAHKDWEFTVSPQGIAGAKVFAVYTVPGPENRSLELTDPDGDGKYTGSDGQVPPGTVTYHFEVRNGTDVIYSSTPGSETFAIGETKKNSGALSYGVSLTPESAENFSDDFAGTPQPHVLTAKVFNTDGGAGLPNVPVNFANLGTCGTLSTTGPVNTNASGEATTTLTSTGACSTSVRAWVNGTATGATAGFDTGEANDTATKSFVSYKLAVTPEDVENESDTDHTFTVTLTKDSGSGDAAVSGASVSVVLDPGTTGAIITAIPGGTIAAGDLSGTCTTDTNGQCTVTIHGETPGVAKLTASYTATNSDGDTVNMSSDGTKRYLAFAISVTPPTATNEPGTDHTFTVTLTRDTGTGGPTGYADQPLSLELTPGTTGATITAVPGGDIADGTHATCTTDANGQCTVMIHGETSGTATLTATWTQTLSGGAEATETGTATKTFSSFDLTVTPGSADNEAGKAHTFTMTLTRDGGPLSGETIDLVLERPAGSDVKFTAVSTGGAIADDTHATCVTIGDGTCTATINGTTPGTVTLTATWHNTIAENGVDQEATATKTYKAFDLTVTPPSATNEVGDPHTFTMTLTQDTGSGPTGLAGESIALVLTRPDNSDAQFSDVSGTGSSISDQTHATCVTDADGKCTATITSTTAGSLTLTATWTNGTIVDGGVTVVKTATKQFLDFTLDVTPPSANNQVGQPHEFTVTLKQDSGTGFSGLAGETVDLVLTGPTGGDGHFVTINGEPATGTTADCVTRADGTCSVIITSSTSGTYTLTATWNNATIVAGGASETDSATKTYLLLGVTKSSCPTDSSPRGGVVDYTVNFTVEGSGLTNATFTDALPAETTFVSASQINGVTPTTPAVGSSGTVKWTFDTIPAAAYSGTIRVLVSNTAQLGTEVTNTVTLDADEIAPSSASHTITITDAGKAASGRAYGLKLDLLGSEVIAPTPDSDQTNPGELLSIPDPLGSSTPLIKLLSVSESDDSNASQATYSASATAVDVDLNIPGILHLQASSVVAKSSSQANASGAGSSRGGSLIQNLIINDHTYGTVSEPTTINVLDPLSGDKLAEVHLLETTRSGAAAGDAQPNGDNLFASGIAVNGIHVKVHVLDLADLIVSRAETNAAFPSGLGCGATIPSVSGSAYALGVNLHPDSPDGIDLGNVKVAEVNLPITGGQDDKLLADVDVPDVVKATVAEAHTNGETTDTDNNGVPVEAHSLARITGLDLLAGTIKARVIEANSDSTIASSTGTATIAYLEIGGTDVCNALGLDSICKPDPNTELLIPGGPVIVELNEQIPEPGGLTVNAVHIWVLGKGNPFGLPVGAEIIISNAHSDAHPAGGTAGAAVTERITTINVKALSSPTALRLKQLGTPVRIRIPAVKVPKLAAPVLKVKDVLADPVSVVQLLNTLTVDEGVLDDALQLVDTLTDPQALLKALDDPKTLLEGLSDPAAALDALEQALGVNTQDPVAPDQQQASTQKEAAVEVIRALRQLTGV